MGYEFDPHYKMLMELWVSVFQDSLRRHGNHREAAACAKAAIEAFAAQFPPPVPPPSGYGDIVNCS